MSIQKLYVRRTGDDSKANQLIHRLRGFGFDLADLKLETVFRVEGIGLDEMAKLQPMFCNPIIATSSSDSMLTPDNGPIREVSYQRGITDPETESIIYGANALGVPNVVWARIATRYQFPGISDQEADQIVSAALYNTEVETIILPGQEWDTLVPQGNASGVISFNLSEMSADELNTLSDSRRLFLAPKSMKAIQDFCIENSRKIRDGGLEMTAAAWGDHCSHTTLRALGLFQVLKQATATINHPLVISAYHDNSGVMSFYDGMAIAIKGETHNSPSATATYGGIMTKHGGVIRDPAGTGKGARLIAGTTIMGTCDPRMSNDEVPKGALHPRTIVLESIRGTKDYTNPMGIPMGWSQYMTHPGFVKCLALGHSLGILPENMAQKGEPQSGDLCVLIGGKTGRDGLHGATVSSGAMTHETAKVDGSHVQIGMPIEEQKFVEAIPELRDAGCIRAITDCGAAGLGSAVGEMFAKIGIWINLYWVPLKCAAMAPWEILLSEAQERMVLAIPRHKLPEALRILAKRQVPATVIGVATDSNRFQAVFDPTLSNIEWLKSPYADMTGEIAVDLPYTFLTQDCPLPHIEVREPTRKFEPFDPLVPSSSEEWIDLITKLLGIYDIADQSAAAHQYDQTVQGATVIPYTGGIHENMPDELMAITPILGKPFTAGIANAVNPFYGEIAPRALGKLMMIQAMAKLVAAGFHPDEITCNANIYTPRVTDCPENAWRLQEMIHGYADASVVLGMPIISGKDSSNGTYWTIDGERIDVPLTLDVLALGRMPDKNRLIPKAFAKPEDELFLFYPGLEQINLGGSAILQLFDQKGCKPVEVNLSEFKRGMLKYHSMLEKVNWSDQIFSRSVVETGGLIRRLFEMSIGSGLGCVIDVPADTIMNVLFGELHCGIVFAGGPDAYYELINNDSGFECMSIGRVVEEQVITVLDYDRELFSCPTDTLGQLWSKTFTEVVI